MPHIPRPTPHLVLGGSRSGKSLYAEQQVTLFPSPYTYLATAQGLDAEMQTRIINHQQRRGTSWRTVETPLHLPSSLREMQGMKRAVLVDCLTLWLTNMMLSFEERDINHALEELCHFLMVADYPLVLVSNEVGSGIVPDNAMARRFRDLSGYANQQVARACASVTLVVAGLPLVLK